MPQDQQKYFSEMAHDKRLVWQTRDAFVCEREHEVLKPIKDAIDWLAKVFDGDLKVLESGCGEGANILHLKHYQGASQRVGFLGMDPNESSVKTARSNGVDAEQGDGLSLPYADNEFHLVFCRDVLHHLTDDIQRERFIKEMKHVACPGGIVIVIEPNPINLALLGFSFLVQAERGVRRVGENKIKRMTDAKQVLALGPSVAWRIFYHYNSPLFKSSRLLKIFKSLIRQWEKICAYSPSVFWAYRTYVWQK